MRDDPESSCSTPLEIGTLLAAIERCKVMCRAETVCGIGQASFGEAREREGEGKRWRQVDQGERHRFSAFRVSGQSGFNHEVWFRLGGSCRSGVEALGRLFVLIKLNE